MSAAAPRPIYTPTVSDLAPHLRQIGTGVQEAMSLLADAPTMARANQVAAQLSGAIAYVARLREALQRERSGHAPDGNQ